MKNKEIKTQLIKTHLLWLTLMSVIFVYSLSMIGDRYWQVQIDGFTQLNHLLQFLPQAFWANVTELGNALVLLPFFALLTINLNKSWAAVLIAAPITLLFTHFAKNIANMPRPGAVLDMAEFYIIGPTLQGYNSAPSGHTLTIFALCAVFLYSIKQAKACDRYCALTLLTLTIALLTGLSRVAVGAHWPIDVVLGALFGWICGGLATTLVWHKPHCLFNCYNSRAFSVVLFLTWGLYLFYQAIDANLPAIWFLSALCAIGVAVYKFKELKSAATISPSNPFFVASHVQ